jgi:hypothetical protein
MFGRHIMLWQDEREEEFHTVAAICAVVLTVILSLLLTVNILERRKDFAVLKRTRKLIKKRRSSVSKD